MTSNSLEAALEAWRQTHRARGGFTERELDELTDHIQSSALALTPTVAERVQLAARRLGVGTELAHEFQQVRGTPFESMRLGGAGLLTAGALLCICAESFVRGIKYVVVSATLQRFPQAQHSALLLGSLVALVAIGALGALLATARNTERVASALRSNPWRMLGVCAGIGLTTHIAGLAWLRVVAEDWVVDNALGLLVVLSLVPQGGLAGWVAAVLVLLHVSRRAVRRERQPSLQVPE